MKSVGIMQPYAFAYLGYFQVLAAVDEYIVYDDVNYIKGGWINRNNILIGGQKILFTISLADASPNKLINEIYIQDDFVKLSKTIEMAYSKAPYKIETIALLQKIFSYPDKNLARFIGNSLRLIAEYLHIDTEIRYSSQLNKDTKLHAQDKVLAICKELQADRYINAIGGQELYSKQAFAEQGMELAFLESDLPPYYQLSKEFIPALSIIDVLMFNSVPQVQEMLKRYTLI
jgi:hypothetical protein